MRLTKLLCTAGVITLGAIGMQVVATQVASAHTPSASVTCTAWSLAGQSYEAGQNNTYGYSVDGATEIVGSFGGSFTQSGTFDPGSGDHTLVAHVYRDNNPADSYSHVYNLSTQGCAEAQVTLCHATDSNTNPYVAITVDAAGAYDGHLGHTGPIWDPTLKAQHIHWGDIIPAFTYNGHEYSLNVPAGQAILDNGCAVPLTAVTAVAPTFADGTCSVDPTYDIPAEPAGVTNTVTGAGVLPLWGKTVTVTFSADDGYTLTGPTVYSHTFTEKPDCRTISTPVNPVVTQATCDHTTGLDSGFSITPAITDGISYTVEGLLVTATAKDGHQLGTLPTGWESVSDTVATYLVTQSDPVCLIDISPTAPAVVQATCSASGTTPSVPTLTLADTANVSYAAPVGPYSAPSTVIVTATAAAGYEFTSAGLPAGWTLLGSDAVSGTATYSVEFATAPLCAMAAEPTFVDDVCRTDGAVGASYTLVSSTGVDYFVSDIKTAAGTYPAVDGSTVTVTAQGQAGYTLTGTGSWSHTFSLVPNCADVSPIQIVTPPASQPTVVAGTTVALASTGVPTGSLLLIGGLLALVGGALCIGGIDRRRSRS
ncbi:MAG: hypothetical protein QOF87_3005 [Pseudonocardiales bacterium]|nr:hypothetical protein [Pseudonocardiales bacterium]